MSSDKKDYRERVCGKPDQGDPPGDSSRRRMPEEEELWLVHRAVTGEVREIDAKKTSPHSFNEIKKILTS